MSHLPSLHLAMTATQGRCHRNHNLKKGGTTSEIRARWCGEGRLRQKAKELKNNITYGIYKITEAMGKKWTSRN